MDDFIANRTLLNPKFEGYKLDISMQDDAVSRFPLKYVPSQTAAPGRVPLSFKEVQSRITHNHLAVAEGASCAAYIDAESRVILIELDVDKLVPRFRIIAELPQAIQSASVDSIQREYPSGAFLNSTHIFIADGCGSLYIYLIEDNEISEPLGTYTLPPTSVNAPFRIHLLHRPSATSAVLLLSSRYYPENPAPKTPKSHLEIEFDLWAVRIDLLSLRLGSEPRELEVLFRHRGKDVPVYAAFVEFLNSYLLIGESSYDASEAPLTPPFEPSLDEFAPIPRLNENLDASTPADSEVSRPPPYSWTQAPDSLTVAFPLPSSTAKANIKVSFTPRTITVHVHNTIPTFVPIPHYSAKMLWDGISPSSSFWTWDREGERSFGLLTLHIEKQHEGTRWMQVFASGEDDVEVPETLDPSELWNIREALEKYTATTQNGSNASGLGLGRGVPSLAEGEIDEDIDSSVGRNVCITWVAADGSIPLWWKPYSAVPFSLLSTPVPGINNDPVSLIIKNTVDGAVFNLNPSTVDDGSRWIHDSTFPALAFVLASKRDTRFTHHISKKAVFAFEGGVRNRGGNVYIYRASSPSAKWAKQAVIKVDDGRGGSLLGVGSITDKKGSVVVICLTEGELVLINGI